MKLQVKLFARARDLVKSAVIEVELPDSANVADLRRALTNQYPELAPLVSRLLVAVGTNYANDATELNAISDVACFPPVSGG